VDNNLTTIVGVATALCGAISYLAKRLFDVLEKERDNTATERARGDRLENIVITMQERTVSALEAGTSAIKEHIALIRDRGRE
jgi:hypothetical protein